jgi:hypothetical protein
MAIVQTLDKYSFVQAFQQSSRKNQFTSEALGAIFDYLEEMGEDVEFDPVGICCDWCEMGWGEISESYGIDLSDCETEEDKVKTVSEYLWENTHSIDLDDGVFVFVQF